MCAGSLNILAACQFVFGYKDFKKEYGSPIFVFLFNIQGVRNLQQKLLEVDRDVFLGVVWLV